MWLKIVKALTLICAAARVFRRVLRVRQRGPTGLPGSDARRYAKLLMRRWKFRSAKGAYPEERQQFSSWD